ncbi:hypothetical protein KJ564_16070 [bacterium]|nr:hypothetical protein [bacterium]
MPSTNTPEKHVIVFTGVEGALLQFGSFDIKEILHALDHLQRDSIPLIITSDRTIPETTAIIRHLNLTYPFIAECGAALAIPSGCFRTEFNYHRKLDDWFIIEFGLPAYDIYKAISEIRQKHNLKFECLIELEDGDVDEQKAPLTQQQFELCCQREYSVAIRIHADDDSRDNFIAQIEDLHLRIKEKDDSSIITADHDEGSAMRFLTQIYREEYNSDEIVTIGIGATWMDAPMLYTVDEPVLVRQADGLFDGRIGRRNMKFTRYPGQIGWNQALITLLTGEED